MFRNRKNRNHGGKAMHRVRCALCAILTLVMCMSLFSGVAFADPEGEETVETAEADSEAVNMVEAAEADAETAGDSDESGQEAVLSDNGVEMLSADAGADSADADAIQPLAASGDAGISAFYVSGQVDGTAPWDDNDDPGDDSSARNNIVRTFDYVNYTLTYITELTDPTKTVDSGTLYVEFTLPCGPDVASFNMNTLNWMSDPVVTYYPSEGEPTTEYENGTEIEKQVLTGYRELVNTSDNTAIPGTGTLSVGVYIGAATNGTELKPEFTAWMESNEEADKKSVTNQQTLTISAAQKFNIGIRQSSEMNIAGTYDLSTGNENAAKDTISNNTSVRGRMEGYGITVMMQNDSVDKGLKGLEFPTGTITFDLTLSEQAGRSASGDDLSNEAGYTPVIWDYDANLRKTAANGGSVGQWNRTWVYTNAANMDCAYGAAPFNKLGCHTYSSIYDSCYDGGYWHMEQDSKNPLVYHVTISDYTIDYEDYNFPTANNTWYKRTEAGTVYTANQACLSAGTTQMVLQFPENAVDAPTYIYYKMVADNFKVGDTSYDTTATYTNTYQLVPAGSIQSGTNFTDDTATTRAQSGHQLGSGYMEGDAYSFVGTNIRLWGYQSTTTDEYVRTNATLIKFDADAFEINRDDQYYANGRYAHGSGSGKVNSFTRYFAGRSENWEDTQVMSDTLINSTDLHYYTDLDNLEKDGYTCVGVLYIADVENINTSSQSFGMIGLTVKDESALIGNVYAACNDSWASYSTMKELEEAHEGPPVTEEGGTINTDWARNGYNLYKAYCSLKAYETMKTTIESGNNGDFWYHKTEYGDDGNIIGGHNVGYYGGTSLLICGEKSTVEISTDKTVYDMDTGERTTTVTVQPAVTAEGNASSETGDKGTTTTTATVKVTLPFDLTYDEGSACWGEEAITPEVIANADGTTTLVFTLPDVTLGETLDALTFDCTIGHPGTADDVTNNQAIDLNATIESTNDHRAKEESFGNSSNTSFNVIRLSATSISKSVDNRMIERNGSFTWTLRYYNGGEEAITATDMADVFPTNRDDLGSAFAGSYSITGIEMDFSQAAASYEIDDANLHFYVSTDYSGTGKDLAQGDAPTDWTDLMDDDTRTDDTENHLITLTVPEECADMTAFYCDLGNLESGDTVIIRISVQTDGNDPGDLYNNLYYESAEGQDSAVQSNVVSTQVVQRNLSGRTWIDANKNGIQDEDETALANTTVTLYQESDVDSTAIRALAVMQAVDVYGNMVNPVKTEEDGSYRFDNLPAGTYLVQFSDVNGKKYELTEENVGDDDSVDSDASFVSNENNNLVADITDLSLPTIADMDRYLYESEHNDAGYYYAPVDITVIKEWDDANNRDRVRPTSITIHLFEGEGDDKTEVDSKTLNAADDWEWTFKDLPQYTESGDLITYTVTEDEVEKYTTTIGDPVDTDDGISYTITNTYVPETVDIEGEKTWDDDDNRDDTRPASITISLYADGKAALDESGNPITAEVTAADDWKWSFTDLPKYDAGIEIKYSITEDAVDDYKTTVNGYDVTNEHDLYRINLNVQKIWSDEDNRDGVRPDEITVELMQNGVHTGQTLTLNEDNGWAGGWTDLEKYQEGQVGVLNEYSVYEDTVSGYNADTPLVETVEDTTTIFLTNEHDKSTIDIEGTKIWDDADDRDGIRPESVTVFLYADGEPALDEDSRAIRATVTAEDDWTWTFTDLPQYRDHGTEIIYTVEERDVPDGYTAAIAYTDDADQVTDGTVTITNTHEPETIAVSGNKTWDDADDQDGLRPTSITIHLLADGVSAVDEDGNVIAAEVTADENGDWTWTFTDIPKYRDHGVEIVYTVTEDTVDGYETTIEDAVPTDEGTSFSITNSHTPELIDIEGEKTWVDEEDQDGVRPESITIRLLADGEPAVDEEGNAITADVTAEDGWAWTFTGLPKYRDQGTEIVYTVTEDALENYSAEYDGCDVTNIHTPDQTSLTVTKVWDDADDQDGIRPDSITVKLLADDEDTGRTLALDADNNWTGSFTELDMYRDGGVEIVYTVEEEDVPDGYEAAITGDVTTGYTITNTHTPEKTTTGTPTGHEGNGGTGSTGGSGTSGSGSSGSGGSGTSGTGAANTDDAGAFSVMLWSLVLLAAAATAAVVFVRRRRA